MHKQYKIRLDFDTTKYVKSQLSSDAEFLRSIGIMDYSLLVGVQNSEYDLFKVGSERETGSPNLDAPFSINTQFGGELM